MNSECDAEDANGLSEAVTQFLDRCVRSYGQKFSITTALVQSNEKLRLCAWSTISSVLQSHSDVDGLSA